MAYDIYTRSFGTPNANKLVSISSVATGQPALILSSPLGGVVSTTGMTRLDSNGNLYVCIDTSVSWNIAVLEQNFVNDSSVSLIRRVEKFDLLNIKGESGTIYITNTLPVEYYLWDGSGMVLLPTAIQSNSLKGYSDLNISNIVYNDSGKIVSYIKNGVTHTVDYSVLGKVTISNTSGASKTFVLNNQGKPISFN